MNQLTTFLERRVNIGSVVAFRIMFGILAAIELFRYVYIGWVDKYFSSEHFHFSYLGFSWIRPLPGVWLNLVFILAGLSALAIAFGWCYRLSTIVFAGLFSYIFLIDKANYQNHFYLMQLISLLLVLMPANAAYSYDAKSRPIIASDTIPFWCLGILRFQFAVFFLFSALARFDFDWTMNGGNPPTWFYHVLPVFGIDVKQISSEAFSIASVYWGLIGIDLLIFCGLLIPRARVFTVLAVIVLNLIRASLVDLGVQPWLLIASATLFLSPEWPHYFRRMWPPIEDRVLPTKLNQKNRFLTIMSVTAIGMYMLSQMMFPLRHLAFPDDLTWADENARFSWAVRPKNQHGTLKFFLESSIYQKKTEINVRNLLTDHQIRTMHIWPDLVHDFAHLLKAYYKKQGHQHIKVYAHVTYSQDGRHFVQLSDPEVNLLAFPRQITSKSKFTTATGEL